MTLRFSRRGWECASMVLRRPRWRNTASARDVCDWPSARLWTGTAPRLRSSCAAWSSHISKPISGKRDAQSPGVVLSVDINEGSNDIGSFFVLTTWLQLARTAIASMGRLGSDQMQTGHAVGTVDPPQMTHLVTVITAA